MNNDNIILVCQNCGNEDITVKAWVNPNTDQVMELCDFDSDDRYCENCDQHIDIITKEDYEKTKE